MMKKMILTVKVGEMIFQRRRKEKVLLISMKMMKMKMMKMMRIMKKLKKNRD